MSLDEYLSRLAARRLSLLYESMVTNDTRGALLLLAWTDVRVCPSPAHHRHEWRYAGGGRFECDICRRLEYDVS